MGIICGNTHEIWEGLLYIDIIIYIYIRRHKRRRDDYNGTQAIMMCNTSGLEY